VRDFFTQEIERVHRRERERESIIGVKNGKLIIDDCRAGGGREQSGLHYVGR